MSSARAGRKSSAASANRGLSERSSTMSDGRGSGTGSPVSPSTNGLPHSAGGSPPNTSHGELYGLTCKAMLIGDSGVGKTCLLVRFKDNTFLSGSFISTVGIDFRNKVVEVDGTKVKLQIWDTAGQERFRSITRAYYRDAQALLLLYDITNEQTFTNVRVWLSEIREYAHDDVVVILLGNKADMTAERVVSTEDGEKLAKEHEVAFMETSAKTGLNVELAFMAIARDFKHRSSSSRTDPAAATSFNIAEYVEMKKKKKAVCCGS